MTGTSIAGVALITGITGQDGSYLADLLLERKYRVIGTTRSREAHHLAKIGHIVDRIELVEEDLLDENRIAKLLERVEPTEVYNLAARASSADLFSDPVATGEINALSVTRLLEAIRTVNSRIRFFQALSSELFGNPVLSPQSETTPFCPENIYAVAKLYAYWVVRIYREQYGIHASCGILFNHESPRRDSHFVTRKITQAVAMIKAGCLERVELGSLEARRDWSFAGDFVHAMTLIVGQNYPDDYVLASGVGHSVRDFCDIAFRRVGLDYRPFVQETPGLSRIADRRDRVGNPAKAKVTLGWRPQLDFEALVNIMVDHDVSLVYKSRTGG